MSPEKKVNISSQPTNKSGAGSKNVCLVSVNATKYVIRPFCAKLIFPLIILVLGIILVVKGFMLEKYLLQMFVLGLMSILMSTMYILAQWRYIVFDSVARTISILPFRIDDSGNFQRKKIVLNFSDINCLQIIEKNVHMKQSLRLFTAYELNIVFLNGSRFNIENHGDFNFIRKDAAILADILHVNVLTNLTE